MASDAEKVNKTGNTKVVFDATRQLCNKLNRGLDTVRTKVGVLLTKESGKEEMEGRFH